jgi:hypothetical protein
VKKGSFFVSIKTEKEAQCKGKCVLIKSETTNALICTGGFLFSMTQKITSLAANNWMEIGTQGSTGYRIPVKSEIFQGVKERIQTYIDAKKPFTVILNGHAFKSSLPTIDLTKITKMTLFEDVVINYYVGTLTPKRQDKAGLRLEIDTE